MSNFTSLVSAICLVAIVAFISYNQGVESGWNMGYDVGFDAGLEDYDSYEIAGDYDIENNPNKNPFE